MKEFTVSASDLTDDMKLTCTLTGTSPDYGSVYVDENMNLIHAPAEADANDTLHLENCILSVETSGNEYELNGNVLSVVRHRLNGSVTAEAWVYTAAPEKVVEFEYNSAGLRVQKKVTDHGKTVTTEYIYHGSQLAGLTCGNDTLHFFYDTQGRPAQLEFNGKKYSYVSNIQGDVVGILEDAGTFIAEYQYTAWGINLTIDHSVNTDIAYLNPLGYKGYIYDCETGMYWLKSRYYLPSQQRFVNADGLVASGLLSTNLYCYCVNSPVCKSDPSGCFSLRGIIYAGINLYNKFAEWIGLPNATEIGAAILQMGKDDKGIYHADFDCWQQYFGYNDLYDMVFDIVTDMDNRKFAFKSGGKDYILWMWKGDYLNLGAGAELGIYTGGEPHWKVDKTLAMDMSMVLSYKGEDIATWSAKHWWLTSFNPNYQNVNATDLTVTFTVTFDSAQMYTDFKETTDEWSFNDTTQTASFTFE